MSIGRSENGRIERQKILDFMHLVGRPATCREICDAVGQTRVSTVSRLGQMRAHGEASSLLTVIGKTPATVYAPLVRETAVIYAPSATVVAARECHVSSRKNVSSHGSASTAVTFRSPGYLRHNGMNRDRPLPEQRGQGAAGHLGPRGETYLEQNT